jgi:capsular exopolysaccharide synthesis family protein
MVIERALEKIRQTQAGATKAPPLGSAEAERRRSAAQAHATGSPSVVPKPAMPQLALDVRAAELNRVMLPGLNTIEDHSAAASYRMLRVRLLHRMNVNRWHTLAITSAGAGEGKSLTALNLALSISRDKSNDVFLIDLDLRNPSIAAYLGVRPQHEVVNYFAGTCSAQDILFSIGPGNLAIASSVTATQAASEMVASSRFDELLAYISSIAANPIIIIDLPPVLVTDEALLIAPKVDATALVVAEGRTRRDNLMRAKQLLADFTFAGVILNRSSENFGADEYYGYGYRYADAQT